MCQEALGPSLASAEPAVISLILGSSYEFTELYTDDLHALYHILVIVYKNK
jgi:hypothetical protein